MYYDFFMGQLNFEFKIIKCIMISKKKKNLTQFAKMEV